jgi:carboxymethylenebutenolidase
VVVVQEVFGVNNHIRGVADGFAADGYLAIAPAMFDRRQRGYETGYSQPEIEAGVAIMRTMDWDEAVRDVQAAADHAKSAGKVGVVGYCWGGAVAWVVASRATGIACSVPYYGGAIPALIGEKPRVPVMFHFGEEDKSIPLEKARAVAAAHPDAMAHFYPGAGHGFNCEQRASWNEASAKLARGRTLEFFARHIG